MAEKTKKPATDEPQGSNDELHQLREIVFGAARREIEDKIANLDRNMQSSFAELQSAMSEHVKALHATIEKTAADLQQQLSTTAQIGVVNFTGTVHPIFTNGSNVNCIRSVMRNNTSNIG